MNMSGSSEDKTHNPFYILELSLFNSFHKGGFLCHVSMYK